MLPDSQQMNENLLAVSQVMRWLVNNSIRDGMLRAVPDPMEARQLANVHTRLLHRIRAIEMALQEFRADLRRADDLFARAERRSHGLSLFTEVHAGDDNILRHLDLPS